MKLIIDIPEIDYECAKQRWERGNDAHQMDYYISKGLPLPKEHGRLIDADVLVDGMEDDYEFCEAVNATPTIIEAERGE